MREAVYNATEVDGTSQRAHGPAADQMHHLRRHLPQILQHGAT